MATFGRDTDLTTALSGVCSPQICPLPSTRHLTAGDLPTRSCACPPKCSGWWWWEDCSARDRYTQLDADTNDAAGKKRLAAVSRTE